MEDKKLKKRKLLAIMMASLALAGVGFETVASLNSSESIVEAKSRKTHHKHKKHRMSHKRNNNKRRNSKKKKVFPILIIIFSIVGCIIMNSALITELLIGMNILQLIYTVFKIIIIFYNIIILILFKK